MPRLTRPLLLLPLLALCIAFPAGAQRQDVPKAEVLTGDVRIVGSGSTVMPIVKLWKEHFVQAHPGTTVDTSGEGTTWGPSALMSGRANIGAMSRPMSEGELKVFRDKTGANPVGFPVALDAVAIFVHASNPLESINLSQVDAIFSVGRRCGARNALRTWGDLGLEGEWAERAIELYGQGRGSGTGTWFQEKALCGGVFSGSFQDVGGGGRVAMSVAESPAGIGFETGSRHRPGVKALALARIDSDQGIPLTIETVQDGTYPLDRSLYLYVKRPIAAAGQEVVDFLRFALSDEGQALVEEAGYVHLSAEKLAEGRGRLPQ
jgi:phosphate transport system substrate-binding protein